MEHRRTECARQRESAGRTSRTVSGITDRARRYHVCLHAVRGGGRARCAHRSRIVEVRSRNVAHRAAVERHRLRAPRSGHLGVADTATDLHQRALEVDRARCRNGQTHSVVRRQRGSRSHQRAASRCQPVAAHQHVSASGLWRSGDCGERRGRSHPLSQRSARRRAGVRRAHRQARVEFSHGARFRRGRMGHVGRRLIQVHGPHQRLGAHEP